MARGDEVLSIGTTKQLFADDELIDSMINVFQVLNPGHKHPGNPLIVADRPWEEGRRLYVYGTAIHDPAARGPDRFRLWYLSKVPEYGATDHAGPMLARSEDGIDWDKPDLGLTELHGSTENNALWANNSRAWVSLNGLSCDPHEDDADRRYKLLAFMGADEPQSARPGYGAYFSGDGLRWRPHEGNPVFAYDHVSVCEVATTIYNEQSADPRSGHPLDAHRYYGSVKYSSWMCQPIYDPSFKYMRRSAGLMTSNDFLHWSPNHLILQPDPLDDLLCRQRVMASSPVLTRSRPEQQRAELYGMGLMPYGDMLLGFLWVLDSAGSAREDGGNQDGPVHVQLTGTRDLRRWKRLGERTPLLSPGAPGEWDCGSIYTCNRPVIVGDEIWLYYSGSNRGHHSDEDTVESIGLATWRLDGFVSINANAPTGTLTTVPFTFSGDRLFLNGQAGDGTIVVEMLDSSGQPISGLEAAQCVPFAGDSVRREVTWKGARELATLAGEPVRLRFHLSRARLYSFQFDHGSAPSGR